METSWRFHGARYAYELAGRLALRVGVDAAATRAVLGLHLGAVTNGARAVGFAGLLDGQVHGGAGSRLKGSREQAGAGPRRRFAPRSPYFPALINKLGYRPNILSKMKINTAPPKPPPNRR